MTHSARIAAVGDCAVIGAAARGTRANGPGWLLEDVAPVFEDVDLTIFNLEMPCAPAQAPRPAHVPEAFRVDPGHLEALRFGGVRVACLANNHIMDFGVIGLECTLTTLRDAGIHAVGAGMTVEQASSPVELHMDGIRFGIAAFAAEGPHSAGPSPGAARARLPEMEACIEDLRSRVDVIIVAVHSGLTYVDLPSPEDREIKHRLARAGADMVLGHHPHVLQGMETVGRSLVAHSLGEFVFDGGVGQVVADHAEQRRRESVVLRVRCSPDGLEGWDRLPIRISRDARPESIREDAAASRRRLDELDGLLARDDYEVAFKENASQNLVTHECKVLWQAVRRADFAYLLGKLARIRPRHVGLFLRSVRRRLMSS